MYKKKLAKKTKKNNKTTGLRVTRRNRKGGDGEEEIELARKAEELARQAAAPLPADIDITPTPLKPRRILGLDCEMVRAENKELILASISIVECEEDYGDINAFDQSKFKTIYNKCVRPQYAVDTEIENGMNGYVTPFSGMTEEKVFGPDAITMEQCQKEVFELIANNIVVGHGLDSDFKALKLSHPADLIKDTAVCFWHHAHRPMAGLRPKYEKLKVIIEREFGVEIQAGSEGHDPSEDARAPLALYKKYEATWGCDFVTPPLWSLLPPLDAAAAAAAPVAPLGDTTMAGYVLIDKQTQIYYGVVDINETKINTIQVGSNIPRVFFTNQQFKKWEWLNCTPVPE